MRLPGDGWFLGLAHRSAWSLVDMTLFATIAWGIDRQSRVAAVSGLLLHIVNHAPRWDHYLSGGPGFVMAVLFLLFFVHGVRGTFAYHRHQRHTDSARSDSI